MAEHVQILMDPTDRILLRRKLNEGGAANLYFAQMLKRLADPYVPFDTGILKNTAYIMQNKQGAFIVYPQIYSRYHWHGKVMVGRAPKQVTNINLKHRNGRRRGPFWTQRMWADRGNEIVKRVAKYTGGRAR
ncbi:MAG: minor capsid protein [Eubacterium sp.]